MILLELFFTFFKIGLFTFGGGASMIPLIQEAVVENGWITEETLLEYIAVAESTPGPIAINIATFVGSTQAGFWGALLATLGVVLPSFIIILLIATLFKKFSQYKSVKTVLTTIRPIVVGLIVGAGLNLLCAGLGDISLQSFAIEWRSLIIMLLIATIMIWYKILTKKSMPVIMIIALSAVLGIGIYLII